MILRRVIENTKPAYALFYFSVPVPSTGIIVIRATIYYLRFIYLFSETR